MKKLSVSIRAAVMILIIYMATAMIVSPTNSVIAAINALKICAEVVIPSLFPFIFCSNMFIALGAARILSRYFSRIMHPIFGVSGAGALALVLGVISGYPVGASCATELYQSGECTKTEAERLLAFCNNSGPMFIIGAVGTGMLGNHRLGILLYITHLSAALLCGMIFKLWGKDERTRLITSPRDENDIKTAAPDIGAAIGKSIDTILAICGFVVIFAVFTSVFPKTPWSSYIYSFLEITGGVNELIKSGITDLTLPIVAGFISFSGISVLAQVISIITPAGLSPIPYILGKLTQSVIAFLLTYNAIKFTPYTESVFSIDFVPVLSTPSPRHLIGIAVMTIAWTAISFIVMIVIVKIFERYFK